MNKNQIYDSIKSYFPIGSKQKLYPQILKEVLETLYSNDQLHTVSRIPKSKSIQTLIEAYSIIPKDSLAPLEKLKSITFDFFQGIPRWKSPSLQFNVGTTPNTLSTAMYALALDENVYAINDGLAGNTLAAEKSVVNILGKLANTKTTPMGFFTFGGAATNLYAVKVGIKKADITSSQNGIPKNIKLIMTEDGHFAHMYAAEWLGIGGRNVITIKANLNRSSCLVDFENKLKTNLNNGNLIACILINGGTSYGHTIDEIDEIVEIRNKLVEEYNLSYKPHIHVDSVIGWMWLFFKDYDFDNNPLKIDTEALKSIELNYNKISKINLADSWGVDFHKGTGSCPACTSVFILNDQNDAKKYLSKSLDNLAPLHQVASEFSSESPIDYTLENSRSAGPFLSALVALHTIGISGYRRNLANLVEASMEMRKYVDQNSELEFIYEFGDGFVNMIRLHPPKNSTENIYDYNKTFFKWYSKKHFNGLNEVEFSYSSSLYIKNGEPINCLKIYSVSPHFTKEIAINTIKHIEQEKLIFDQK